MDVEASDETKIVKKRRSPGTSACDYCRRLHEKCDGQHPCERCTRRNKTCTYTDAVASATKKPKRKDVPARLPGVSSSDQPTSKKLAVTAAALVKELEALDTIPKLKETARYRYEASNLIQSTLISPSFDGAKLAKYQGAMFGGSMALMPFLAVPEPRYLQAALGPVEAHTTAEQLLSAAEHLLILGFGSMPFGDLTFTLESREKICRLVSRLVTEFYQRVLTDLSFRVLNVRAFLCLMFNAMGDVRAGADITEALLHDWDKRDQSFDSSKKHEVLCLVYGLKWSFFGDDKALYLSRMNALQSDVPSGSLGGIGFRHSLRRLHTDHPETIKASHLLVGDITHYDHSYVEFEALGRLNNPNDLLLCVYAAKSIILMDVGRKDEALQCVESGLKIASLAAPEYELNFHIAASICILMKVSAYLEHAEFTSIAKRLIDPWIVYFRGCIQWINLIDALRPVAKELGPPTIIEPVFWPGEAPSPSSDTSSIDTPHPSIDLVEAMQAVAAHFGDAASTSAPTTTTVTAEMATDAHHSSMEPDIWSTEWEVATASALGLKFDESMNIFLASGFD